MITLVLNERDDVERNAEVTEQLRNRIAWI
jgi:hypothetical protein